MNESFHALLGVWTESATGLPITVDQIRYSPTGKLMVVYRQSEKSPTQYREFEEFRRTHRRPAPSLVSGQIIGLGEFCARRWRKAFGEPWQPDPNGGAAA